MFNTNNEPDLTLYNTDLDTYISAFNADNAEGMQRVKAKHHIAKVYPDAVVMQGLYAHMQGKDLHREMNDMMDTIGWHSFNGYVESNNDI